MSNIYVNGTIALFFANFISKIFGAIYRLPLSNFLGAEGMGLYQMAFPLYSFLLSLITSGVSVTLTRKIANLRAKKLNSQIYKQYKIGKRISLALGIVFFIFLVIFSYPIAIISGNKNATFGFIALALGFIFAALLGTYRGYYQGYSNMAPTAISQLLEQGLKLIFGLVCAFFFSKISLIFGVFGALLGVSISEFITFIYFKILNRKKIIASPCTILKSDYISFLKESFITSTCYIMLPLAALIESFLIVNLLKAGGFLTSFATSLYGIQTGMILPLINMPNVLISAIALASMPNISYKISRGEDVKKDVSNIFKIAYLFILPCSFGMFILSEQILSVVYPTLSVELLSIASNLLKFSAIEMFFMCFLTISNSVLQAMGQIKHASISLFIGTLVKEIIAVALVLNSKINIFGVAIASIFGYFITSAINLHFLKKKLGLRLSFVQICVPIISCAIFSALCFFVLSFITTLSAFKLFGLIFASASIYFTLIIVLKQLKLEEIKNLGISKNSSD